MGPLEGFGAGGFDVNCFFRGGGDSFFFFGRGEGFKEVGRKWGKGGGRRLGIWDSFFRAVNSKISNISNISNTQSAKSAKSANSVKSNP